MVAVLERTALARPDGRTAYTPQLMEPVYEWIAKGVSPSGAAEKCGISRQALSDWRQRYPEVADGIQRAIGEHKCYIADALRACRTKWGTPDPKALELETRRYEEYAIHQVSESTTLSVSVALGVEQLAALHAYHCASNRPIEVSETVTIPLELSESSHAGEVNTSGDPH